MREKELILYRKAMFSRRDRILSIAMSKGENVSDISITNEKAAIDMLRNLTGLKNSNKTVTDMNRTARSDDNDNTFI